VIPGCFKTFHSDPVQVFVHLQVPGVFSWIIPGEIIDMEVVDTGLMGSSWVMNGIIMGGIMA
jgi:hypothetical protein